MPVQGSREDGDIDGALSRFDLLREIADSEAKEPWSAGIHARVLTKKPDFRVVLISMETAVRLKEHRVDGTSWVQVLKGRIRYSTGGQAYDLQAGRFDHSRRLNRARGRIVDQSRILLTISWPANQQLPVTAP